MNRRTFLAGSAALGSNPSITFRNSPTGGAIRGVAFDAFPIFDPRSIAAACDRMFGARGRELLNAWRARQFEYQWLRALGGQYQDFWRCTAAALEFACDTLGLAADESARAALLQEYLRLEVWPDVPQALGELRERGLSIAFLSNATPEILESGLRRAGLRDRFDQVISTDRNHSFKPEPRAYQLGVEVMGLRREQILFVAFAGWDVAGAKWFGYPTFWNNRLGAAAERLEAVPEARGPGLADLVRYLDQQIPSHRE
jgi:2-haloacid dehalogenase